MKLSWLQRASPCVKISNYEVATYLCCCQGRPPDSRITYTRSVDVGINAVESDSKVPREWKRLEGETTHRISVV